MKLLYEASNSLEAHMILNLLEQEGLSGRIDGEYLQGGLGELPATTVRVIIEESDYSAGMKIIDEWVKKQPVEPVKIQSKKFGFGSAAAGFFIGMIVTAVYLHFPINVDGIDYNNDGKLDETWETHNYQISKTKIDRNFDGTVDFIFYFNRKGHLDYSSTDEDFNGTFETKTEYHNGNPVRWESDTQDVGVINYIVTYKHGVIETETFIDLVTRKPKKVNYFGKFKIEKSEIDINSDGTLDTIYEYDSIGEIVRKYNAK
jgi:Putative prokaryotic signal transducing protein